MVGWQLAVNMSRVHGNPIRRSFSQGDSSRRLSFSQESAQNNRNYSQYQDQEPSQNTLFHRKSSFESFPIGSLSQKTSLSSGDSDVQKAVIEDVSVRSVSKFDEFTLRSRHNDICNKLDGIDRFIRTSADAAKKADFQISEDLKGLQSALLIEVKKCSHSIQEMQHSQQIMIDNVSNLSLLISSSNKAISQLANEFPGSSVITSNKRNMLTLMDATIHQVEDSKSAQMCTTIAASSMIDPNSDMSDSDSDSHTKCMSVTEYIALKRRRISHSEDQPISFAKRIASPKERSQNIYSDNFKNLSVKNSSHSVISATDSISLARDKKVENTNPVRSGVSKPNPNVIPSQRIPNPNASVVPAPMSVAKAKIIEQIYRTTSSKPEVSRKIFSDKALPSVESEYCGGSKVSSARCESFAPVCKQDSSEKNRSISDSAKINFQSQATMQSPAQNLEKSNTKVQVPKPGSTRTIEPKRLTLIEQIPNAVYTMKLVINKSEVGKSSSTEIPGHFPQSDQLVGKSWFTFLTSKKLYYPLSIVRLDEDVNNGDGGGSRSQGKLQTIPHAKVSLTIRSECSDEEDEPDDFTTQTTAVGGIFWFLAIRSVHVSGRVLIHFSCPDAPQVRPLIFRVPIIPQSACRETMSSPIGISSTAVSAQQAPKLASSVTMSSGKPTPATVSSGKPTPATVSSGKPTPVMAAPLPSSIAVATVKDTESSNHSKNGCVNDPSTSVTAVNHNSKPPSDSQRFEETAMSKSSWMEDEVNTLLRGYERHGARWLDIKNDPEFAISLKGRSARALGMKYSKMQHSSDNGQTVEKVDEDGSSGGGGGGAFDTAKPSDMPVVVATLLQQPRHIISSQEYTMELLVVSAALSRGVSCPIPQSFQQSDPIPGFEDSWFTISSTVSSRSKYYTVSIARIAEAGGERGEVQILPTVGVSLTIRSECSGDADDPAEFTTKAASKSGIYRFLAVDSIHVPGQVLFHFSCPDAPYIRPLSFTVPIISQSHSKDLCDNSVAAAAVGPSSSTSILDDIGLDRTMNNHFEVVAISNFDSLYKCTRCGHPNIHGQVRALEHIAARKSPGSSAKTTAAYYCLKPIVRVKEILLKYWAQKDTVFGTSGSSGGGGESSTCPPDSAQVRGSRDVGSHSMPSMSSGRIRIPMIPPAKPLPHPKVSKSRVDSNRKSGVGRVDSSLSLTHHHHQQQSSVSQRDLSAEETCTAQPGDLTWLAEWGLPSDRDRNREGHRDAHTSSHSRQGRGGGSASPESVLSTETEEQWAGDTEQSRIVGLADQQAYLALDMLGDPDLARDASGGKLKEGEEEEDDDKTCITSFEAPLLK
eukprot:gene30719-40004_t